MPRTRPAEGSRAAHFGRSRVRWWRRTEEVLEHSLDINEDLNSVLCAPFYVLRVIFDGYVSAAHKKQLSIRLFETPSPRPHGKRHLFKKDAGLRNITLKLLNDWRRQPTSRRKMGKSSNGPMTKDKILTGKISPRKLSKANYRKLGIAVPNIDFQRV